MKMLLAGIVIAIAAGLLPGVAHADSDDLDHTPGQVFQLIHRWQLTCTPGGPYSVVSEPGRVIRVWQEVEETCDPGWSTWRANVQIPAGDWRILWTVGQDGTELFYLEFIIRDPDLYRVWLPVVY